MVAVVGFVVLLWLFSGVVIFHRVKNDIDGKFDDYQFTISPFKSCPKCAGNETAQDYSSVLDIS